MIIVIEGSDGTGKTTLAREFEKIGFRYVHNGKPQPEEDLFMTYLKQLHEARGSNVVFDRLHIGELVYGPVMRDKSLISTEEMIVLNRIIYASGGTIIFCQTDTDVMLENWKSRNLQGREYVTEQQKLLTISKVYQSLIQDYFRGRADFFTFDYSKDSTSQLLLNVQSFSQGVSVEINGSPQANFLIVGEQAAGEIDEAFCSMRNSSGFLNRCLWDAGYKEIELSFVNALDTAGNPHPIHNLWKQMFNCKVIALGQIAQELCLTNGVPFLPAPHPQFIKRFKLKNREEYVNLLRSFSF